MHRLTGVAQALQGFISVNENDMGAYFWLLILLLLLLLSFVLIRFFKRLTHTDQHVSENVVEINDGNFKSITKKGVSLVDFWAPWCMPCRVQNPVINELADEFKGKAKICKLNVDENKKTAAQLNIRNIPNIIIFRNGKPEKQFVGVKPKNTLKKAIEKLL